MSGHPPPEVRFKHPIGLAVWSVLWRDWDPIGINDVAPDDEYDAYVWPIIGKVMQGATKEEVADYLDWAADVNMGMPGNPKATRAQHLELAEMLVALRPEET